MSNSVAWVDCVIWVEMVVLLIDSPFSQASHLCSLSEIFWSALRPSHCKRYHWEMWSEEWELGVFRIETVLDIQSILGFHLRSQGIPRMTCSHPKLRTMRSALFLEWEKRRSMWAFHLMVSLTLAVPSMLYAWTGLGRHCMLCESTDLCQGQGFTYFEGGTHKETQHPQRSIKVKSKRQGGLGHNQMSCGFTRLMLLLHRTRMKMRYRLDRYLSTMSHLTRRL